MVALGECPDGLRFALDGLDSCAPRFSWIPGSPGAVAGIFGGRNIAVELGGREPAGDLLADDDGGREPLAPLPNTDNKPASVV